MPGRASARPGAKARNEGKHEGNSAGAMASLSGKSRSQLYMGNGPRICHEDRDAPAGCGKFTQSGMRAVMAIPPAGEQRRVGQAHPGRSIASPRARPGWTAFRPPPARSVQQDRH